MRAPERAADGLLSAGDARPRRAAARGGGAPARRERQRRALRRSRATRSVGLAYVRSVGEDGRGDGRRRARAGRPVRGRARPRAARAARPGDRLAALVAAGACDSFGRPRRGCSGSSASCRARRRSPARAGEERQLALPLEPTAETPELREQTVWERMLADYRDDEPLDRRAPARAAPPAPARPARLSSRDLPGRRERLARCAVAGMVVARQRPSTANGVVFMLLEDEHGQMNLIVPPPVYERLRAARPRRAAAARARPLRARRPKPQRRRRELETLGPLARALRRRRRRLRLAPGRPPLRPPLATSDPYPHPQGGAETRLPQRRRYAVSAHLSVTVRAEYVSISPQARRRRRPCRPPESRPMERIDGYAPIRDTRSSATGGRPR